MNVAFTPVPEPGTAEPAEPARPAATVTSTAFPWMLPEGTPGTPVRGRKRTGKLKRRRQAGGYETGCVDGRWYGVSLRGGPLLDAATEDELKALILAERDRT
jgi:hypothetical protein